MKERVVPALSMPTILWTVQRSKKMKFIDNVIIENRVYKIEGKSSMFLMNAN